MNAVALRTERAIVDWLIGIDWSASPIGAPACLTSYGRGAFEDPDVEDVMPQFPRLVVAVSNAVPVTPFDTTCEMEVRVELQLSADDTNESSMLGITNVLDASLQDLFLDGGANILTVGETHQDGPFTAYFATPSDFGSTDVSERSRVFQRTFTLFASAT
jgi:hypothetical protein